MSTSYERTFRAEVLKECLAKVAGRFYEINTEKSKEFGFESGVLANQLLKPEYDTDEALDMVKYKLNNYETICSKMEKGE